MSRARPIAGLIAAAVLLLSSAAHSLAGWPAVRGQLEAAGAPPDLVHGMKVGWLWGGACMLAFAFIAFTIFGARLKSRPTSTTPALYAGVAYVLFGAWALLSAGYAPFYWIFIIPGALLIYGATGGDAASA